MPRSAGGVRSQPAVVASLGRDRLRIAACVVLITAIAWTYLIHLDRQMSQSVGHDAMMRAMGMAMHAPWSATDLLFTFMMWTVMMVGMMSPSAAPVVLLYSGMQQRQGKGSLSASVLLFALGYLAVWTGFSGVATLVQWALHEAALLASTMAVASPRMAGAILVAAGAYQLTPVKSACLTQCQSPLGFLMGNWRDGSVGAFTMGLRHGVYCLGCCWALMGVLFAVGVMNLVWVAALTAFILAEKVGRSGAVVARIGAIALLGWGVVLLIG
ncbi:MAG: DUF2182 domain-containing protein [Gemmatimonadaceae bacterium]